VALGGGRHAALDPSALDSLPSPHDDARTPCEARGARAKKILRLMISFDP